MPACAPKVGYENYQADGLYKEREGKERKGKEGKGKEACTTSVLQMFKIMIEM